VKVCSSFTDAFKNKTGALNFTRKHSRLAFLSHIV